MFLYDHFIFEIYPTTFLHILEVVFPIQSVAGLSVRLMMRNPEGLRSLLIVLAG